MRLLILLLLALPAFAQFPVSLFAAQPETLRVDSAVLVIGDVIVGKYAYVTLRDSVGQETKYIIFPPEVAVAWIEALDKNRLDVNQRKSEYWKQRFIEAPDAEKGK